MSRAQQSATKRNIMFRPSSATSFPPPYGGKQFVALRTGVDVSPLLRLPRRNISRAWSACPNGLEPEPKRDQEKALQGLRPRPHGRPRLGMQ
jgi:hypothetical protein